MISFCTCCSNKKSPESGEIRAIRRYQSSRIKKVYDASTTLGLPFRVLSGKYGLVPPQQPIPWYDHLLTAPEVPGLVEIVVRQIRAAQITGFVYFTKPLAVNPDLVPYHDTLAAACRATSISFYVVELGTNT